MSSLFSCVTKRKYGYLPRASQAAAATVLVGYDELPRKVCDLFFLLNTNSLLGEVSSPFARFFFFNPALLRLPKCWPQDMLFLRLVLSREQASKSKTLVAKLREHDAKLCKRKELFSPFFFFFLKIIWNYFVFSWAPRAVL